MAKKAKRRRHTLEFKRQVVEQMKTCQNIHEQARELGVERKLLYTWKYQFEGRPEPRQANLGITAEDRKEKQHRDEIAKLKAALADKRRNCVFPLVSHRRGSPQNQGLIGVDLRLSAAQLNSSRLQGPCSR